MELSIGERVTRVFRKDAGAVLVSVSVCCRTEVLCSINSSLPKGSPIHRENKSVRWGKQETQLTQLSYLSSLLNIQGDAE